MHPYATDSSERTTILHRVSILGAFAALTLSFALALIVEEFSISVPFWVAPWWSGAPAAAGLSWWLYNKIDRQWWRSPWLRRIGVDIPDLNGRWEGTGKSSHGKGGTTITPVLIVRQTWSEISLYLETDTSLSKSQTASLLLHDGGCWLAYEYRNEPKSHARGTMHPHRGHCRLQLKVVDGQKVLEGEYFNAGRDRRTWGDLHFTYIAPEPHACT